MTQRRPCVGGNWKMNTDRESAVALARAVANAAQEHKLEQHADVFICPPFVYLDAVRLELEADAPEGPTLGAQDVSEQPNGAFTGEISSAMLQDLDVEMVLTGHSERRHVIGETDDVVNAKTRSALDAGLMCCLCVGETLQQREAGDTDRVNETQVRAGLAGVGAHHLDSLVIAYEPVWAIGTGRTATPDDAQAAHAHIRALLADLYSPDLASGLRILYGGSVKPGNAAELFAQPDIDGGLIGGASLDAEGFIAICQAAAQTCHHA